MKNINEWFGEYQESHQNPVNKTFHFICVPAIFFSIMGLLWSIPHSFLSNHLQSPLADFANFATIAAVGVLGFYLRLSLKLFWGMLLICFIGLAGNYFLQHLGVKLWLVSAVVFFLAWIGQFYGHKVEGKKPSFLKDIQFLLIGPAWVLSFLYKKLNIPY